VNIGIKIGLGFALSLIILGVIGVVAYRNTAELIEDSRWVSHTHVVLEELEIALSTVKDVESGSRAFVMSGEDKHLDQERTALARSEVALQRLSQLTADNPTQQARLRALVPLIQARTDRAQELIATRRDKGYEAALALFRTGEGKVAMDAIRAAVAEMQGDERRLLERRNTQSEVTAASSLSTIVWGTLFAFVLVGIAGSVITRGITGSLRAIVGAAERLGGGDLTARALVSSTDEVGRLAQAFNKMGENLGTTLVSAETEKQARRRIEGLLETIAETANGLVSATSEILAATTQQASGAQEQAAAVAQTVSTVDEVVQTSEQSAARARSVSELSQRSAEVGRAGARVVDESVRAMDLVREQVESLAESILALAEQAQAIGDIIATVNEIAEQTNLLALNAAIEASRAGEHGKGFGVVAGEVKLLAEQSKKATHQVRQILGEIQRATNSAVMATEEGTKSVGAASKVITQAGDTIKTLSGIIDDGSQAATQIAASAGQQATGMAQIHVAMRNISQVTNQNLGSTRQTEQAAKDLSRLGERLRERLGGFQNDAPRP
jgi:methyl-accepting chemotaxis protein